MSDSHRPGLPLEQRISALRDGDVTNLGEPVGSKPLAVQPTKRLVVADEMLPCEGSNATRTPWDKGAVMCAMCGKWFAGDVVPPHDRMDILSMLNKGDFRG